MWLHDKLLGQVQLAVGWKMTLRELALRMRCSRCGKKADDPDQTAS
jgi:hypothetical protein